MRIQLEQSSRYGGVRSFERIVFELVRLNKIEYHGILQGFNLKLCNIIFIPEMTFNGLT